MLFSKSFIYTLREDPKVAECTSHKYLLKGCFLYMVSSGIYSYLPLGLGVLDKINNIIRKHMNNSGAQELLMSALQPLDLWQKTGRDKDLKEVMFKFKDRKNRMLCLGPTHEELITEIVRKHIFSYKQLPLILYQIQTKYRDEPRSRFGLMRSCEFIMKDAYSFDIDEKGLECNYAKMLSAYNAIFKECGLEFVMTQAESGFMGGDVSHEFMVPAQIGEDVLFRCKRCNKFFKKGSKCVECKGNLTEQKMIEIGHIFKLGTKYSDTQGACFLDKQGKRKPVIMGCYGIGVSRILPSIIEVNHDDKGIIWPKSVSPQQGSLVTLGGVSFDEAMQLVDTLEKRGFSILFDDRDEAAGVKFNDAYLVGNPYILIMGKNYSKSNKIDVEVRKTGEKLSLGKEELIKFLEKEYDR
ncbi:MAG: proline--tRNA ligase [Candidatus Omnitrophota bacterium]|nr:MAG: proline--tRNA ligase [Candidatus Omnitrophota bacterium]